jgi:hypothetical protein
LSLLTGLGSRERGKDDVTEVIEGRRFGLGSLDFSLRFDEILSNFSRAAESEFESERPRDLLANESLLLLPALKVFEYVLLKCLSAEVSVYDFDTGLGSRDLAVDSLEYAEMLVLAGLGSRERAAEIRCKAVCGGAALSLLTAAGLGSLDRPRVVELVCL